MHLLFVGLTSALLFLVSPVFGSELADSIKQDYDDYLGDLWDHFHRHPELSLVEVETARRMAAELRAAGFAVTEGVGGTGIVAMFENGDGPLVMMRADMDGLPIEEKSGRTNASVATQKSPITGEVVRRCMPVVTTCTSRVWSALPGRWWHASLNGAAI